MRRATVNPIIMSSVSISTYNSIFEVTESHSIIKKAYLPDYASNEERTIH